MKNSFLFLTFSIIFMSCSDSAIVNSTIFGIEFNGKTSLFNAGDKFTLELDLHFDGGYQWFCSLSDSSVVKLDSVSYRPKGNKLLVGGLSVETFYFRALKSGTGIVNLTEKRGWEKDVPPINTFQFTAVIK